MNRIRLHRDLRPESLGPSANGRTSASPSLSRKTPRSQQDRAMSAKNAPGRPLRRQADQQRRVPVEGREPEIGTEDRDPFAHGLEGGLEQRIAPGELGFGVGAFGDVAEHEDVVSAAGHRLGRCRSRVLWGPGVVTRQGFCWRNASIRLFTSDSTSTSLNSPRSARYRVRLLRAGDAGPNQLGRHVQQANDDNIVGTIRSTVWVETRSLSPMFRKVASRSVFLGASPARGS